MIGSCMHSRILSLEVDFWSSLFVLTFWSAIFWAEGLNYGRTPGGFKLKGKVWDRPLWAFSSHDRPVWQKSRDVKRLCPAVASRNLAADLGPCRGKKQLTPSESGTVRKISAGIRKVGTPFFLLKVRNHRPNCGLMAFFANALLREWCVVLRC